MNPSPREHTVETPDGVSLYVRDLGPPDAPPLLLLHGGPAAHHDYLLPAFATLSDERRVILYDQRGGGRSRTTAGADLSWRRHVEDVETVQRALGISCCDVGGYSFGGLWAMLFAADWPSRVDRLVLISAAPPHHGFRAGLDEALRRAQARPEVEAERAALERSGLRETLPEEYRRRRFALSVSGYFADPRLCYALTPFLVQSRSAETIRESLGAYDFRSELGAIDGRRTLVLHGEDDPIAVSYAMDTARLLGARLETFTGCGHVPYVEVPGPFFAILRGFLGGSPS